MARFTQADLNEINKTFEDCSPMDLLRWAKDIFGGRVAMLSAMQRAGSMVCHLIGQHRLNIPVLFVDTGVNFQETLETRDRLASEYGLEIITINPAQTMEEQTKEFGVLYLTPEGQKKCCLMRKSEPLLQVKGRYDCLIGSLRRAEGGKRGNIPILSIDTQLNCIRANPLANVTDEQLDAYIHEHQVIVNPLHSKGSRRSAATAARPLYYPMSQSAPVAGDISERGPRIAKSIPLIETAGSQNRSICQAI